MGPGGGQGGGGRNTRLGCSAGAKLGTNVEILGMGSHGERVPEGRTSSQSANCFNCGQPGHMQRDSRGRPRCLRGTAVGGGLYLIDELTGKPVAPGARLPAGRHHQAGRGRFRRLRPSRAHGARLVIGGGGRFVLRLRPARAHGQGLPAGQPRRRLKQESSVDGRGYCFDFQRGGALRPRAASRMRWSRRVLCRKRSGRAPSRVRGGLSGGGPSDGGRMDAAMTPRHG